MTDKKITDECLENEAVEERRRKLLKTMGVGSTSALAVKWVAPVVTAVSIPAHAQTSFAQAFIAVGP